MTRKLIKSRILLLVPLIIISFTLLFVHSPSANAQTGFVQIWGEEFNGSGRVDTTKWNYDLGHGYPNGAGNWGTGEIENMTDNLANIQQTGGNLVITMLKDGSDNWSGGRIETQRSDFAAPVGGVLRIEGRLQQPNQTGGAAAGYWPAFWTLGEFFRPSNTNWPNAGEIDIMEDVNGLSQVYGTLHCGVLGPPNPCGEKTGRGSGAHACPGCQTGMHIYAIEYDRSKPVEEIRWFLDTDNYFTLRQDQVDAGAWNAAVHHGFFIILNFAIGGEFPAALGGGPFASTVSGSQLIIDYVHVLTKGGCANCPTVTVGPTMTPIPSTPYNARINLPGTVQAEDFDRGGQGVAFNETTPGNQGGFAYRTDQAQSGDVDIANNCNICVNFIAANEWLKYSVNVTAAGTYNLNVREAGPGGGTYHVELADGTNITGSLMQPNTGGSNPWDNYVIQTVPVTLPAGNNVIKLIFDSGPGGGNLNNLDWFSFTGVNIATPTKTATSTATNTATKTPQVTFQPPTNTSLPTKTPTVVSGGNVNPYSQVKAVAK